MKKLSLLLVSSTFIFSCVNQVTVLKSPSSSVIPTPLQTTSTPVSSVPTTLSPMPITTSTPSQIALTPTPSSSPIINLKSKNFNLGIDNSFIQITDQIVTDYQKESREINNELNVLKPSSLIIDLNKDIIDVETQGNEFTWVVYDNILESITDKNIQIYFRIKQTSVLSNNSTAYSIRLNELIEKVADRYKERKINWIIGDKINDNFSLVGTQKDFVDFYNLVYKAIKIKSPESKVILGSFVQAETFGKTTTFTLDNLLSYINLGLDKISDGFIFEVYSLNIDNTFQQINSIFKGTNYNLIKNYYDAITDLLNTRQIKDKKLFLITSTYGGDIVNELLQTEQEQADDIFRRFIFGSTLGFDKVFLSNLYDRSADEPSNFFKRLGIQVKDLSGERKKIGYWMYKFISDKLSNSKFVRTIDNLPSNLKGFVFESDSKTSYIIWNEDKNYKGNIFVDINKNSGTLFVAPNEISLSGISNNFNILEKNQKVSISFNSFPLSPRIVEVNK